MDKKLEEQLYRYHAELCQVFSHPKRLEIIHTLREGEVSVGELSQRLGLSPANLSQHLAMMRERRLVTARKEGNQVFYSLANPKLLQAFDLLRQVLLEQLRSDAALVADISP